MHALLQKWLIEGIKDQYDLLWSMICLAYVNCQGQSFWTNKTVEWKPILTVNHEGIWSLTFVQELIWGIHDNWTGLYWIVLVFSIE